jgi:hypothetical protein
MSKGEREREGGRASEGWQSNRRREEEREGSVMSLYLRGRDNNQKVMKKNL